MFVRGRTSASQIQVSPDGVQYRVEVGVSCRLLAGSVLALLATVSLAAEPQKISGVVVTGRGGPVSDAQVRVTRGVERVTAVTDRDGRFSLSVSGPGQYDLEATRGGFAHVRRTVVVQSKRKTSLRLVLPTEAIVGGLDGAPPPPPLPK